MFTRVYPNDERVSFDPLTRRVKIYGGEPERMLYYENGKWCGGSPKEWDHLVDYTFYGHILDTILYKDVEPTDEDLAAEIARFQKQYSDMIVLREKLPIKQIVLYQVDSWNGQRGPTCDLILL